MIDRETVNYAAIHQFLAEMNQGRKRGEKLTVKDFLALSTANDPFYADAPGNKKWGKWFADQWKEHKGHLPTVHVRGLHYALVGFTNSETPVYMPDGKVYENTIRCWKKLEKAGKYARYNGFLPVDKFEDRRAQTLTERTYNMPWSFLTVTDPDYDFDVGFPDFPDLPAYDLVYQNRQRYRLEVWCEKSTQETVLLPIAEKYLVTMLSAQGELSISAMIKAVRRAEFSRLPTRILYISDFDPAGRSMPVAASRKLEFLQKALRSRADIQLYPIALTHEQCITYELERTPIKESERRKLKFEERYGSGATELDALEAKHPGELGRLLEREILEFYDDTLEERTDKERERLQGDLDAIEEEIHDNHDSSDLEEEYDQLKAAFEEWYEEKFRPFKARLKEAYQGIKGDLEEQTPDIDDYPLPEAKEVEAADDCLYDSTRCYQPQLIAYNEFAGKFSHLIEDDEEGEDA